MMRKLIQYFFALFIFLIPWQARFILRTGELNGGFWEYGTIAVYATDVIFFAIIAMTFIGIAKKDFRFQISDLRFIFSTVFFIGYFFLSIFWSTNQPVALYAALKLLEGIALFLIVRQLQSYEVGPHKTGGPTSMLLWAFIASAVVQSVLAIAQFFTQSVFAWPLSGIASKLPHDLGVAVVQFGDERWLRAYGSLPHPNILGAFLVVALLFLFHLTLSLSSKERGVKNYPLLLGEGWVRSRWLLLTAHCSLLTGLFFTFSRAAWIAFFVGLIVYAVQSKAWREKIFLQFVFLLVVLLTVLTTLFFPLVRTRIGGGDRLEIQSNRERAVGYSEALQLIKAHPFIGVGVGNYTAAVARELRPNDPAWSYQPVHNVLLLILSELGIIGFLIFITPLFPLILRGRREILAPLIILALFDHSFWTLHSGILLLWFSIGMMYTIVIHNPDHYGEEIF